MRRSGKTLGAMMGIAAGGSAVTGFAAFIVGIIAALSGSPAGAGLALVAAALAFGLLANAVLRTS
jgi:hypothetical protein